MSLSLSRRCFVLGAAALGVGSTAARVLAKAVPVAHDSVIHTASGRTVSITEFRPVGPAVGTILFSHGAASAPQFYGPIIWPMVAAGWRVLAPLHVDSRLHPDTAKFPGLASWQARLEDMAALIAHIGHQPYVAVGHSYGGLTALVLGGAQPAAAKLQVPDRLAKAVIAYSPPPAIPVLMTREGYGQLARPALIQTGTADLMPGMTDAQGWKAHLDAYDAAATGGHRYGLVLSDVTHYFGGLICDPRQPGPLAQRGMADANRIAGLFLSAYGRGDRKAGAVLDSAVSDQLPVRLITK